MKLVDLDMLPEGRIDWEDVDKLPEIKIAFLCDGRSCGSDCEVNYCTHTKDVSHAKNFTLMGDAYIEKDGEDA